MRARRAKLPFIKRSITICFVYELFRGLALNFASTHQTDTSAANWRKQNPCGFSEVGENKQLLINIVVKRYFLINCNGFIKKSDRVIFFSKKLINSFCESNSVFLILSETSENSKVSFFIFTP